MQSWRFILILTLAALFASQSVEARPVSLSKRYETDKKFGVGAMLGVPASGVAKLMITSEWALDFGVGAYIAYRDRTGVHLHGDILWHPFVAVEGMRFLAPFYVGLGGRYLSHDDISRVGLRLPVGISFDFDEKPYDIFLESAFVVDVSTSNDGTGPVDMNAVVGFRYFLF